MTLKLNGYRINIYASVYKDQSPEVYIISPYIYVDYYSSDFYYDKRYDVGFCWLYWDFCVSMYISK